MESCIVPGCPKPGRNNLGVRLRRPDTSAIWAPNTQAYLCDDHAESGARITLVYEAADTAEVEVDVHGSAGPATRTTSIRDRDEALADTLKQRINK